MHLQSKVHVWPREYVILSTRRPWDQTYFESIINGAFNEEKSKSTKLDMCHHVNLGDAFLVGGSSSFSGPSPCLTSKLHRGWVCQTMRKRSFSQPWVDTFLFAVSFGVIIDYTTDYTEIKWFWLTWYFQEYHMLLFSVIFCTVCGMKSRTYLTVSHLVWLPWDFTQPLGSWGHTVVPPHEILLIGRHHHEFLP